VRDGKRVFDAAAYGVPQRRRRLVVVAGRCRSIPPPPSTETRCTVRDAISRLQPSGASGDPLHDLPENRSQSVVNLIRTIPKDGGGRGALAKEQQLRCHRKTTGFKDVYGRMAWDRPAPTITGGCHNPSKGRFLHPEHDRAITLREAALLQSFPPGYQFSLRRGKLAAAAMIGNALPPRFVAAQATAIRQAFSSAQPGG
jgi:DNA (cytosine-5)-methyltransferase 1